LPKIPGVNHLDVARALEKTGFAVVRQGEHIVMSDGTCILTIPRHIHGFGDGAASAAHDTDE